MEKETDTVIVQGGVYDATLPPQNEKTDNKRDTSFMEHTLP